MFDLDPLTKKDKAAVSRIIARMDWLSAVWVLVHQRVLGGVFRMKLPEAPGNGE